MKKNILTTLIILLAFAQGFSQVKKGNSGESNGNAESTYNEEMKISKKYLTKGIILTSFGASTIIVGAVFLNEYINNPSYTDNNDWGVRERDNTYLIVSLLAFGASVPFDIIGPIMLSKSAKHRKLAREANPDMTFKPVILPSGTSYAMGVGIKIRL